MRLSLIGPVYPYRGGIALYHTLLCQTLNERHDIQVVSFKRQYPKLLYPGKTDLDPSRDPVKITARYLLDPIYPWTWNTSIKEIFEFRPDLCVFQWWTTFWAPTFSWIIFNLKRRHIPVLFLIHNTLPHEQHFFDKTLARTTFSQVDYFITQTPKESKRIRDLRPNARIIETAHPVYDQYNKQRVEKEEAKKLLGVSADRPILLYFGLVRPYKGVQSLIRALGILKSSGVTPTTIIAGEFWESDKNYLQLIHQLGLQDHVILDNRYIPDEEVPLLFSAADALIAPYLDGSQSGAVKIALGFDLPVIASKALQDDVSLNGSDLVRFFTTGDSEELAAEIAHFLGNDHASVVDNDPSVDYGWDHLVSIIESLEHGSSTNHSDLAQEVH